MLSPMVSFIMPHFQSTAEDVDGSTQNLNRLADRETFIESPEYDNVLNSLKERWRRQKREAPLLPGPYSQMLSIRPEMQIAGDWMLVPATRNLHWRYAVLRSAFIVCKHRLPTGETLHENVERMVKATEKIWNKISTNTATINGRKKPINGNLAMLFADADMGAAEKTVAGHRKAKDRDAP